MKHILYAVFFILSTLSVAFAGKADPMFGSNPMAIEVARLSTAGDVLQWVKSQTGANDHGEFSATVALNVGTPDQPEYQIVTMTSVSVNEQNVIHISVKDTRVTLESEDREELPVLYRSSFPVTKAGTYLVYESWNEQLRVTVTPKPNM